MIGIEKSDKYGNTCYSCGKEFPSEKLHILYTNLYNNSHRRNTSGYFCNDCLKELTKQIIDVL